MRTWQQKQRSNFHTPRTTIERRARIFSYLAISAALLIILRLFVLQIIDHGFYAALASGQHEIYRDLLPRRGEIFLTDREGKRYPLATNTRYTTVALDLRKIKNPALAARVLAEKLGLDELELRALMARSDDPYEPVARRLPDALRDALEANRFPGLLLVPEEARIYPEPGLGGHLLGFVGSDESGKLAGRYGIEGHYDKELRGLQGFLVGERDPRGRLIRVAQNAIKKAEDGSSLVLTIDRAIQFFACERLRAAVERHGATGGSVVVLDPKTGRVLALCGAPDFDPNIYSQVSRASVYNNPALFLDYEPGSVMKPITMAGALEEGKVEPDSTYVDQGSVVIGGHIIKNSDEKSYGRQTMTAVLEASLNTGAIFAMRQIGVEKLGEYFARFGFGEVTGIDLGGEVSGDTTALREPGEIYAATASFGQGITVTVIQLAEAFAAIANQGRLMRPQVVATVVRPDGELVPVTPEPVGQAISPRTAKLLGAMLVSVVERGHGKRAGVPGYYIAGKTGTAQIPKKDEPGYEVDATIGTFAGFGPIEDPVFAMAVRIDRPQDVRFAESSAAPLFGEIARFLLQYYQVTPTR